MKKPLISIITFIILIAPLTGEEINKKEILQYMEFPVPVITFGNTLNNPLFALTIYKEKANPEELRKKNSITEKEIKDNLNPERLYQLGNYYKELKDYDSAIKYYNKYLELKNNINQADYNDLKTLTTIGDIYFSIAEIDNTIDKNDFLEKSLAFLIRSVELNNESPELWIKLGDCYLTLGKSTEALYCYEKAQKINNNGIKIYARIQEASFQRDYLKLIGCTTKAEIINQPITEGFDFTVIETAINNSSSEYKESLKLQQYISLIRLMLLKNDAYMELNKNKVIGHNLFSQDEIGILNEADKLLNSITDKNIGEINVKYISGIINYLKGDYSKALSDFMYILNKNENTDFIHYEILFIAVHHVKEPDESKNIINNLIKINPRVQDYLALAGIELKNNNLSRAEMLCKQSLKINSKYIEAYSGLSYTYAMNGNYIAAEEMIKKGNDLIHNNKKSGLLFKQLKVNEAAIAMLKNEKERAYLLLRSVLSADNNGKALIFYNRYFIKK